MIRFDTEVLPMFLNFSRKSPYRPYYSGIIAVMEREKIQTHSFLHAFCTYPKFSFETQDDEEEVVLVLRAHPITQLYWIINGIFLIVLLVFINFALPPFLNQIQTLFLNISIFIFILAYMWFNFLGYYFNVGIITTKRITDIDFHAVIYKELTEARLSKVEDITSKSGGYFASLFNYGNVFIQTAGTEVNVEFLNVPRPSEVVKFINSVLELR